MSRTRNVFATGAILVGSSLALLTGGIAKADPLPPPAIPAPGPAIPDMAMITQLASNAPQLLQAAATMFAPKTAAAPAAVPPVAALAPLAPLAAPIAPLAPLALPLTGAPAIQAPVLGNSGDLPASALPSTGLALPTIPGLPLGLPGDIASLMPGAPGAGTVTASPGYVAPSAAATSPMPGLGALFPASALP